MSNVIEFPVKYAPPVGLALRLPAVGVYRYGENVIAVIECGERAVTVVDHACRLYAMTDLPVGPVVTGPLANMLQSAAQLYDGACALVRSRGLDKHQRSAAIAQKYAAQSLVIELADFLRGRS